MLDLLLASLSVAGGLFVWFNTTALLEYAQLLRLPVGLPQWLKARETHPDLSWLTWVKATYGLASPGSRWWVIARAFVVRGVTCPYCLGVWFSIGAAVWVGHWDWCVAIYCASILIYRRL